MRIIKIESNSVDVQFSVYELIALRNVLNEVYNSLPKSEFETRMGVSRKEVRRFAEVILQRIKKLNKNSEAHFNLLIKDILTFNDALNEVCHGFKVENFETKLGISKQEAKLLLSSINKIGKQIISNSQNDKKNQILTPKSSNSLIIRKKCYLETNENKFIFYLSSLEHSKTEVGLIIVLETKALNQDFPVRSTAQKIYIKDLQNLRQYLDSYLNYFYKKNNGISKIVSLGDNLFQIQVLPSSNTLENQDLLTTRIRFNLGNQKNERNTDIYLDIQGTVNLTNIRSFTSEIQEFLSELYSSN